MKANYGASAVLCFYFVSGWLMAASFLRFQKNANEPVKAFYIDRIIKLWPSYALVLSISVVFFSITGVFQFDWRRAFIEVFIIPNAFTKMIPWHEPHALNIVPPSWSLGVEACFYLAVPLLSMLSYRSKVLIAYLMIAGHLFVMLIGSPIGRFMVCDWPLRESFCTIPVSDYFGMDFPVFAGVTFLLGQIAFERYGRGTQSDSHLPIMWAIYLAAFLLVWPYLGDIQNLSVYEVLLAMSFFLPVALVLLFISKNFSMPDWDKFLGDLSYPMFLVHFLVRYAVEYWAGPLERNPYFFLQAVLLYFPTAAILMLFQRSVDGWRYQRRGFRAFSVSSKD